MHTPKNLLLSLRLATLKSPYFQYCGCWLLVLSLLLLVSCGDNSEQKEATENASTALFSLLSPEESGVDFINDVRVDHRVNMFTLAYIYNGGGVAVLDYDKDGWQDIFFVNNQNVGSLYRNQGGLSFENVTSSAGFGNKGGHSTGVAVADVNADGWPDICVARSGIDNSPTGQIQRTNLVYLNQQDGTFVESGAAIGLNSNRPSTQSYFFDYDGDGDLDCYVLNTPTDFANTNMLRVKQLPDGGFERNSSPIQDWESDQLYRNDGGVFTDVSEAAGISNRAFGLSVLIHDFNQDNRPDIYVGNDYIEPDLVYINQGDGTFRDEAERYFRHTSANAMGSDLGDINNDGWPDLVSLDMLAEKNRRHKELETNMKRERYDALARYGYGYQMMWNTLQLNNGDGSFSEIGKLAGIEATDWSWAPLFGDYDNDLKLDLYITNGYRYDINNLDYLTYVVDSLNQLGGINQRNFPNYTDFLRLVPSEKLSNYAYQNQGDLTFANRTKEWGMEQPSYSSGAAYADFDRDGDLDMVVNNLHDRAFIYRNEAREKSPTSNYLQIVPRGSENNPAGYGLRVKAEIGEETRWYVAYPIRGFMSTVQQLVHIGIGEKASISSLTFIWPDGKRQTLKDVAANQTIEAEYAAADQSAPEEMAPTSIVFSEIATGVDFEHRENDFDDFDREFLLPRRLSREGPALAVADVDGDGKTDLFIGGASGEPGGLYRQSAGGRYSRLPWNQHPDQEDVAATFLDADGDGDQDLFIVSGGNEKVKGSPAYADRLYLNDGRANFTYCADCQPANTHSGACVLAFDYDDDGDEDLLVGGSAVPGEYPRASATVLLQNQGGKFTDVSASVIPELGSLGMVSDLAFADLDADGEEEIILVGPWQPITVFTWNGSQFRLNRSGYPFPGSSGWWNTLAVDDLDGDGRPEIVAGNDGTNSRLRPSPEAPVSLYATDFDGNGTVDPILTVREDGREYPYVNREALLRQLPGAKKSFPRNRDYARATIDQVFPPEILRETNRLDLETLYSTVFYNTPEGFVGVALPSRVQISPVRDIEIADLDGDGRKDIMLVGNDYGREVQTARLDAGNGTILLNLGNRNWEVLPGNSGFLANGDARKIEGINTEGGQIFVVANNDDRPQVFHVSAPRNSIQ